MALWMSWCVHPFSGRAPGTPDDQRVPLNAGVWRYHPRQKAFQVFAWGTSNPWGLDFNEQGQAFVTACVIPHLYHMVQGGHYQRQQVKTFRRIPTICWERLPIICIMRETFGIMPGGDMNRWHLPIRCPGGRARSLRSADLLGRKNFPAAFRNHILMHNVHAIASIKICWYAVVRATWDSMPGLAPGQRPLVSGHQSAHGPDGSVYLIDWYDPNACHRTQPEIWDRSNGRVYNLRYENRDKFAMGRLPSQSILRPTAMINWSIISYTPTIGTPALHDAYFRNGVTLFHRPVLGRPFRPPHWNG